MFDAHKGISGQGAKAALNTSALLIVIRRGFVLGYIFLEGKSESTHVPPPHCREPKH